MKFYVLNLFKFVKLEFKGLSNYYDLDDDNNNLNKSNSTDATNNIQNFSSSEIHNTEFINSKDFEKNKNVLESLNSDTFCKKCQNKIESSDKPPCKDYNESLNSPNGTNNTDKFGYNFVLDSIPKNLLLHMARLPKFFEKLIFHSVGICLDSVLFELTFMPIQAVTTVSYLITRFLLYVFKELKYMFRNDFLNLFNNHKDKELNSGRSDKSSENFDEPRNITLTEVCGCVRFLVLLATVYIFSFIDTSKVYHNIKAQPIMKLYVLFNMLEICERLCRSFNRDIMDSLVKTTINIFIIQFNNTNVSSARVNFQKPDSQKCQLGNNGNKSFLNSHTNNTQNHPNKSVNRRSSLDSEGFVPGNKTESLLSSCRNHVDGFNIYYKFVFLYCFVVLTITFHAFIHLVRVLILNIAINSPEYTMFLVLITNNFGEIKSSVFKKHTQLSLFIIFASDAVERCHLVLDGLLVFFKMSTSRRNLNSYISVFSWLFLVYGIEVLIDLVKHSYLIKFNKLLSETFEKYDSVLIADRLLSRSLYNLRSLTFYKLKVPCKCSFSFSHISSRRLGFISSPIVTLIISTIPKMGFHISPKILIISAFSWLSLFFVKITTSILLTGYCIKKKDQIYSLDPELYKIGAL
ncbi:Eukaryotic membrane family protein [Theileria parva strain Muguga]|uniref:Eukaryotic membrane protein family n=1 Tax=Theileria parva TaxID=5875 RepID=Q4N5K5_THEPA|nr:Eukaryotic membrane family protein [Theileria parva strain Muguga]EAN32568.1 Eukaryotic membrane family protein [Theileria parva strain Muguga]|eukprot:XP_764851.1 hypothetical protein [Theileria parva strain Muguga]